MTYDLAAISATMKAIAALIDAGLDPVSPVEPQPEPVDPTPVDPVPVPVDPTPVDPVPVDPAPVDPAPVDPVPVPVDPAPALVLTSLAEIIAALKAAQGGETIYIGGDYPSGLTLKGIKCASRVVLQSVNARADFIDLIGCANIHVADLLCYPTAFPLIDTSRPLFRTRLGCVGCAFIRPRGMGHATGRDYHNWTLAEWQERRVFGMILNDPTEVIAPKFYGVRFGITVAADDCRLTDPAVFGFSVDAFRWLGDRMIAVNPTCGDMIKIDASHNDLGQSWEDDADKVLSDVQITGWTAVDWLYPDRLDPQFTGVDAIAQGSGNFDGMYDRWVMKDCTFLTDHYHGASWAGLTNSVLDGVHCMTQNNTFPGYPAIRIDPAKATRGGFPSHHNTIRNCIAPRLVLNDDAATRVESGNIIGQPRDEAAYQAAIARVRAIAAAA